MTKLSTPSGSSDASKRMFFDNQQVSVHVKGLDRFKIPGSFKVHLKNDGKTVAKRAFFQADGPEEYAGHQEPAVVDIGFIVPIEAMSGGPFTVEVVPADRERLGDSIPLEQVGNPTINARLLISTEE